MSMWSMWNQRFVCNLEVFWLGILSLLVFWCVIIDSVGTVFQWSSVGGGGWQSSILFAWYCIM